MSWLKDYFEINFYGVKSLLEESMTVTPSFEFRDLKCLADWTSSRDLTGLLMEAMTSIGLY